jgi:hypothetical protein
MSIRSMAAQAAVTIATTRATTNAAVRRFEPVRTGAGGGGGGAGIARAGTTHGDGTLHGGVPAGVDFSSLAPTGRSSSIPSMISGCPFHL